MTSKLLHYVVELEDGSRFDVRIDPTDPNVLTVNDVAHDLSVEGDPSGLVVGTGDGQRVQVQLRYEHGELVAQTPDGSRQRVRVHLAETHEFRAKVMSQPPPPVIAHSGRLVAPIAGNVLKLSVANKARVAVGDPLLILEAMKMQNTISAPLAGHVSFAVAAGQTVRAGDLLATIVPEGSN